MNMKKELTEQVMKLGEDLPRGSQKKIAKKTGYSQQYISNFFAGAYQIEERHKPIILAAQQCILDEKKRIEEFEKNLQKVLSK